jgi:two-component system response regulator HydG
VAKKLVMMAEKHIQLDSIPVPPGKVLLVEDDDDTRTALNEALDDLGFDVEARGDGAAGFEYASLRDFDVVLTDIKMPKMDGLELCRRLNGDRPHVPVVVMTAFGDLESALGALRAGAFDFITKPFTIEQVSQALQRALRHGAQSSIVVKPATTPVEGGGIPGLIGSSAAMQAVAQAVVSAAPTEATVLITGESGTGKELVARALHAGSRRAQGPFVPVSCAAVPSEMLEAELFGHVRGAFTGANEARVGLLRQAEGGTLFLDEIGDMPLELQPKLLRALQERALRPVGSTQEFAFDVRLVAATNRDLTRAIQEGKFREDLYFRLNVLRIHLPALRERAGDVQELATHFLRRASNGSGVEYRLTPEAERRLLKYPWPGNVRELQNCIEAAVALASGGFVGVDELPTSVRASRSPHWGPAEQNQSLEAVERRHILLVLDAVSWNKAEAARTLGIDRATLYRKLRRYGIDSPS